MTQKNDIEKISDWFWAMIKRVSQNHNKLQQLLWDLSEEESCRFHKEFRRAMSTLSGPEHVDVICSKSSESSVSEDGISDIAQWVVWQGCEVYDAIQKNPRAIPGHIEMDDPALLLGYIGAIFFERFRKDIAAVDSAWPSPSHGP